MAKQKKRKNKKRRIKIRKKILTSFVLVLALFIFAFEVIRADIIADIIPVKNRFISGLESGCLKDLYPFIAGWYRNVCEFAGNSFTQVTAFFSVFSSITFFVIGRFKEGIIGVPLEELLHTEFDRNIIEKRKIFVWFSPLLVGAFIVIGAELLAFYVGMLTLANVIFSAYCAAIATDRRKQEKIAWYMVESELEEIAQDISDSQNFNKRVIVLDRCTSKTVESELEKIAQDISSSQNFNKRVIVLDRCTSKTLAKMVNAMRDSRNLFFDIGDSVFDWFLNSRHYYFSFCADIVYYNIQSMVCTSLKDAASNNTLNYPFAFLEKQIQKAERKLEDTETLKNSKEFSDEEKEIIGITQEVSEAIVIGIICGIISSDIEQGKELIENMFSTPWTPLNVKFRKLYILLYLEHLYFNGEEATAVSWIKRLSNSYVNFFGDIYYLLIDKYSKHFLRYFILWENAKKDLTSTNLDLYHNLLDDIRTLDKDDSEARSFIGCILKGRKRITNEKRVQTNYIV